MPGSGSLLQSTWQTPSDCSRQSLMRALTPDGSLRPEVAAFPRSSSLTRVLKMHTVVLPLPVLSVLSLPGCQAATRPLRPAADVCLSAPLQARPSVLAWESSFSSVRAPKCSSATAALASVMFRRRLLAAPLPRAEAAMFVAVAVRFSTAGPERAHSTSSR